MTTPNQSVATNPLPADWPSEAGEIVGRIQSAIGIAPGSYMGRTSMAAAVGDTDLKTELRRLYSALGGHRGTYDPNADELRALYTGTQSAAFLMAKASTLPMAQPAAPKAVTEPTTSDDAAPFRHPVKVEPAKPAKATPASDDAAGQLATLLAQIMAKPQIDEHAVGDIVDAKLGAALALVTPELEKLAKGANRTLEISVNAAPAVKIDKAHKALPDILNACSQRVWPFLVGPAGSGKTTLAKQIADALALPFYMSARVSSEYKLTGFIDATGKAVATDYRRAYEGGGVFLFDEADASDADAFTALNASLANGFADFPDKQVEMHANFIAIAAGNTYGRGANRQYVGRQQLDAATLDRFAIFDVDYDEELELALAGNEEWTRHVQKVRAAIEKEQIRHIVSPRASISGAKLLAAKMPREKVEEAMIWKGMAEPERNRIKAALRYV